MDRSRPNYGMNEAWKRLEDWLGENLPETLAALCDGCDAEALSKLEEDAAIKLPESFKAFYSVHDGQRLYEGPGLFYGVSLLSLSDIRRDWMTWVEVIRWAQQTGNDMDEFQISLMPNKVKPLYANEKWIPFASFMDSNHLGLDFDPGPAGKVGQVINFGEEEEQKAVLANSFEDFIDHYARGLENGNAVVDREGGRVAFLPAGYKERLEKGTRLGGFIAHRFVEEPSIEEWEELGILL